MRILLIGAKGRMGQEMSTLLREKGHNYVGIDKDDRERAEGEFDVIVDFSSSACLGENLDLAKSKQCPIVIGTTGLGEQELMLIDNLSKSLPIFLSSNFSLMFNVMIKLVQQLKLLQGCDFVVEEIHHKHKKDSPSGSCKMLLKEIEKMGVAPQLSSLRAGEVIGKHILTIYGENEILTIGHEATGRKVFCEGALTACEYILSKKNGLFTMGDLIAEKWR